MRIMMIIDRHMAYREIVRSEVIPALASRPNVSLTLVTNKACEVREGDLPEGVAIATHVTEFDLPQNARGRFEHALDKGVHNVARDLAAVTFPESSLAQMRLSRLRHKKKSELIHLGPFRALQSAGITIRHLTRLSEKWGRYPGFADILDAVKPDLIVYSNMMLGQMDCLREARRRSIPLVLDVPTWDQVTSKGPMTVQPDYAIAWSEEMKFDLVRMHGIPEDHILVGGVLYFDPYFAPPVIETREQYCARLGLDPRKKIVNYCLSRAKSAPSAIAFIDRIHETIRDGRLGVGCQLVVRANPLDNVGLVKELSSREFVTLELPKGNVDDSGANWLPAPDEAADRIASLSHADVLLMIQSTMILDGCCMDRPIINLAYDAGTEVNEWQSVRRIFKFNHARRYQEIGSTWKVESDDELEQALASYLKDPSIHRSERRALIDELTKFQDGKTYRRWTDFVYQTALRHNP